MTLAYFGNPANCGERMQLIFCNDPFDTKKVDPDFGEELSAAQENGFATQFFSFETLTKDKDAMAAVRKIKPSPFLQKMVYRGWMLRPADYSLLYDALLAKNYQLVNSPPEYQNCHYLPDSLRFISAYTPKTIWVKLGSGTINFDTLFNAAAVFGDKPLIVKDFVKSQKHYWDTACYVPKASDKEKLASVVERFMQLQGSDLNEGIVLREFVELEDLSIHAKSGMPLKQEYRLFFLAGHMIGCYPYWEEGDYSAAEQPPLELFSKIAQTVESNFFTLDVAKQKNGAWVIIETGDGQVAGIPENVDKRRFYEALNKITALVK